MESIITKDNLVKAAILGGAAMLALRFTGGKSKLVQGAATIGAIAVAMPFAGRVSA